MTTATIAADKIARLREQNEHVIRKLGKRIRARQLVLQGAVVSNPRVEKHRDDEDAVTFKVDMDGATYSVMIWSKKGAKVKWALKALSEIKRGSVIRAKGFLSIYTLPRQQTSVIRVKARRFTIVDDPTSSFAKATLRGHFYDAQRVGGSVIEVRVDAGREPTDAASREARLDRFMVEGAAADRIFNELTAGDPIQAEGNLFIGAYTDGGTEYAYADIPTTTRIKLGISLI